MPKRERGVAPKGKAPEMDWEATDDPDAVAEEGWQDEEETPWTCTTCKRYVKMKHLMKLWPRAQAIISGPRREGLASNCQSAHFLHRYHEVTIAVGVRNARPEIMLYSNMAMVWAEIVLHKDVDWRTVAGRNVSRMDRSQHFIPTTWNQLSDCWPRWSNRSSMDNFDGRRQEQHTPPRQHDHHNYNDYNYGNNMNPTPVSFGGGGSDYYGGDQFGTTANIPQSYSPSHRRETYDPCWDLPSHQRDDYEPCWDSLSHPRENYEPRWDSPKKEQEHNTPNCAPVSFDGYGRSVYPSDYAPPPTYRTRQEEEAEFNREMREATFRSQEEYIRKLEDDNRFNENRYNNLYDVYSSGQYYHEVGPSRRHDNSESDDD